MNQDTMPQPPPMKPSMPCPLDGLQCRARCGMWAWLNKEKKLGGCSPKIAVEYIAMLGREMAEIKQYLKEIKDGLINDRKV